MNVSIVIPVYNERENIDPLAREFDLIAPALGAYEAIFVDDGSTDGTWDAIVAASRLVPAVRGLRCLRNAGQTSAMLLGLTAARGEVVVTMDGDLQNNPSDVPRLVAALRDADVVCGYRATRRDPWSRRAASRIGNAVRNWVTRDGLRDTGCSLKAFRRACVADLPPVNGAHRFMGAYFALNRHRILQIPVDHRPRQHGVSKYTNLKRLPRTVFDLLGFVWYRSRRIDFPPVEPTP